MLSTPTDRKETMERHIMFLGPDLETKGILLLGREGRKAKQKRKKLKETIVR